MYENNKDIGWKKKNNSSNGSYDDSLIKNQINILDDKINNVEVNLDGKVKSNGDSYIHFSFDDVTNIINVLASGTLNSIYDNTFLAMLKTMHETYGFVFSLYIQSAPTTVSTKHRAELQQASSWLKWGIHSLNGSNYQSSTYEQGKSDWNKMVDVILTLTGTHNAIDRIPRLHQFYGSEEALQGMRDAKLGAKGFLSTDDTRNAYYLPAKNLNYLYDGENDHLTDFKNSLVFYRTDLRLDWFSGAGFTYNAATGMSNHVPTDNSDILGELEKRFSDALYINTWDCYVIFTHEWQPQSAIQSALTAIGEFAKEHNIPFDFPQNHQASISQGDIQYAIVDEPTPDEPTPDEPTPDEPTYDPNNVYNINDRQLFIVEDIGYMKYEKNITLSGGYISSQSVFTEASGRAASTGTILKVNGGETISLTQVIDGVTLYYAVRAFKDTNCGLITSPDEVMASKWLSELTLPSTAKYILFSFKKDDGTADFTDDEITLLSNALTIK